MAMSARQFEQVFRRANATIALVQNPATRPESIAVTFDGRITVLEFVPNQQAKFKPLFKSERDYQEFCDSFQKEVKQALGSPSERASCLLGEMT